MYSSFTFFSQLLTSSPIGWIEGSITPPSLEEALAKQAVAVFMSKYLPDDVRQVMGTEEKNELSEWLLFETSNTKEDAPTAEEMVPGANTSVPAQKTEQEMAQDQVIAHAITHMKYAKYIEEGPRVVVEVVHNLDEPSGAQRGKTNGKTKQRRWNTRNCQGLR